MNFIHNRKHKTKNKMNSDLVDALPYIDNEFNNPEVRLAVAQMVEDETKRYRPTKNYLESLPHIATMDITKFEVKKLYLFILFLFFQTINFFHLDRYFTC